MSRYKFLLISTLVFLFSCKKEEKKEVVLPDESVDRLIILNEGNFRSANASVDMYFPEDHKFSESVFSNNNQKRPIGDVAQSMQTIHGNYWIVINNSNKIEIVEKSGFRSIGSINGFNSPRNCLLVSSNKVYVSDLYENKIYIVDPNAKTITGTIESKGWTEEMVLLGDKAFVCQVDSSQVLVIDTQKDSIIYKINTPKSPLSLLIDANDKIWVACSGGISQDNPALVKINSTNYQIERTLELFDNSKSISQIAMSPDKTQLYYLIDDLYSISIGDTALSSNAIVNQNGRTFYELAVDHKRGDIYLSDAIDYQQRGVIYRYNSTASLIHQFNAGLIPGYLYFDF